MVVKESDAWCAPGVPEVHVEVVKEFTFDAAHYLPGYKGPCGRLHGHTWKLQVGVTGHIDGQTGMVMDFKDLKATVQDEVISVLDHTCLNEYDPDRASFPNLKPTAEFMLCWLVTVLKARLPNITFIRLYESATSYAEWRAPA